MARRYWLKGEYTHTVDQKGRTYLPARFRDVLGENVVVGLGLSNDHMVIYPEERYDEIAANIEELADEADEGVEILRDYIFNNSYDVETDKTGRFTIPPNLRNRFNMGDEIVITGDGDKAKIWTREMYDRRKAGKDVENIQSLASKYKIFKHRDDDDTL